MGLSALLFVVVCHLAAGLQGQRHLHGRRAVIQQGYPASKAWLSLGKVPERMDFGFSMEIRRQLRLPLSRPVLSQSNTNRIGAHHGDHFGARWRWWAVTFAALSFRPLRLP